MADASDAQAKTAAKIAAKHGVGEKTVRRAADYAAAVDAISEADPEAKAAILAGKVKTTRAGAPGSILTAWGGQRSKVRPTRPTA